MRTVHGLVCTLLACFVVSAHGDQALQLKDDAFPIGGFTPDPLRDSEAGFSIAGPAYVSKQQKFSECEAAGLPMIYTIGAKVTFPKTEGESAPEIDFELLREEIRAQVAEVCASKWVYAWYLVPEELRYWRTQEMEYLRVVAETIREADPKKRPVWMYEPNHRPQEALEKVLPYLQIAGKGMYVNYSGRKNERVWLPWTIGQQKGAIQAVNQSATSFAVLEMFQDPEPGEERFIRDWVRHDSYAALLSGVKAIVIYSFAKRAKFETHPEYYEAYSEVARELNGKLGLGGVFLRGAERPLPSLSTLEGPTTIQLSGGKSSPADAVELPTLTAKAYKHQGQDYLFLVNSSPQPMRIEVGGDQKWQGLFSKDHLGAKREVQLPAWGVAGFRGKR